MALSVTLPRKPADLRSAGHHPRTLDVLNGQQTAVQRQLRRSGLAGYEPLTQATLLALAHRAPSGTAVYDVGANIGLYAALIDALTGNEGPSVYAFEPTPEVAETARRLREVNGLHYRVVESAVADTTGTATLHRSLKSESSNSLNPAHRDYRESVRVPVTTLDLFTAEHGLTPHLVKIDVETYEAQVLDGALRTIREARPWIVCELLPKADHTALRSTLATVLALGYHLYQIEPGTPWLPSSAEEYREFVGHPCRDWLLAPRKLTPPWYRDMRQWLIAVLACDERTNLTSATEPLPAFDGFPRTGPAGPSSTA
ncbi:FkbM family methyltransferase [Streptomyces sp. ACA25]|uniref:FkbM family methyltransferase n=1 Tax=Streptomyces sp. ACA25 TaxID=3022596 RepID=UPI002306F4BE|nr:FkbM family methyltransferase [Streptomyces sp. ACA25]MDB1089470.1 FkbM family methyltransferase [Streptomyces sp. ACA25]